MELRAGGVSSEYTNRGEEALWVHDSPEEGGGAPQQPLLERTEFLITPTGRTELSQLLVS